ncbi:MAG TPA: hypothetical protein VIU11_02725 [Nakamurella sp.]
MSGFDPFAQYDRPANRTAGSMVPDGRGGYRRVTRLEAAHHEFVDVFVGTMILLCVLAVSVWDVLVFVLLWPIEAIVRKAAMPPLTRKLAVNPAYVWREMHKGVAD